MRAELLAGISLPFLGELVGLFVVSVLIAYLSYRLRLVPIAGFLIAGALIGPYSLGLMHDLDLVNQLAEIGVILLLFTIGVEFSLEKLADIGRSIFVGGGIQVGLTILVVVALALPFGVPWTTALFTGCLVALSSTAIVLGLLNERAETDSPAGRLSLAMLIFQDLAVIVMVLLVPILGGEGGSGSDMLIALLKALLLVGAILLAARLVVPRILDWVVLTRRHELFLLTVVAICFGTAWLTSLAGVSLALGAFLAGLVVSESHYREHALSEILPLRTIFSAVFFVAVGMLFNPRLLIDNVFVVLAVAAGVLLIKALVTAGSVMILGFPTRIAVITGVTLAQIGEFSFVLDRAGREAGLSPISVGLGGEQLFIAVTVLLMLLTPFLVQAAPKMGERIGDLIPIRTGTGGLEDVPAEDTPSEDHVIVIGYGPAGQRLVRVLRNTGIPYVVIDLNPTTIQHASEEGIHAIYGDAARVPILLKAGIRRAKVLLIAIYDRDATRRIIALGRYENPTLQIFVRTRFMGEVESLQRAGADIVVPEELETTVRLFSQVLGAYMIPPDEVTRQINLIREDDYSVVRGSIQEAHMMVLQGLDEEGLHTRAVAVRDDAPIAGKTLAELGLRNNFGLTVLAVRRGRRTIGSPAGTFRVEPGDRLVLIGMADQFAACASLFRGEKVEAT